MANHNIKNTDVDPSERLTNPYPLFPIDSRASESGDEWWKPSARLNRKTIGGERRIAAYLWFNVEIGEVFTMKQIRDALGEEEGPDSAEQLNRRLRAIRRDGWIFRSYKNDKTLAPNSYKLESKGLQIWLDIPRNNSSISDKTRTQVFERDGFRCVRCGIGSNEPYPDDPGNLAKLTAGHRTPGARRGKPNLENLQTECARCNEPIRQELRNPETLEEIIPEVESLKKAELQELLEWMLNGYRSRSKLDRVFDRARMLSHPERTKLIEHLHKNLGLNPNGS